MDMISVIVPVYNIESYIGRCVESITSQTFTNLQIILVDDGSSDRSGEICDRLAIADERIEVLHKPNGGLSDARNFGLEKAKGQYVAFVDGDDFIEPDMYECLYKAIQANEADISSCGYYEVFEDMMCAMCCARKTIVLDKESAYEALFSRGSMLGCTSVNKLFRRSIFDGIRYKMGIQSEDLELIYRLLDRVQRVVCIDSAKYHYVHRENSITTSAFSKSSMDVIHISEEMIRFIYSKYPDVIKQAYAYQAMWLISGLKSLYNTDNKEKFAAEEKYIKTIIRKNFKWYAGNSYVYWAEYILLWAAIMNIYKPVQYLLDVCVKIYHSLLKGRICMYIAIATMEFVTENTFGGGVANYSANLARLLRKHGNEVSVFVVSTQDEEFVWENGITIYRIRYFEYFERLQKIGIKIIQRGTMAVWDLFGASYVINRKINQVNKKHKIDIVHFCSSGALALFRSNRIPAVIRCSTYLPACRCARMPVFEYDKSIEEFELMEKIQFKAMKRTRYVFAPSYNVAKLTEEKIKKQVSVIESPFCMEIHKIDDSVYKAYLRDKRYFLFFGTLNYLKGVQVIAGMLGDFFACHQDCYFVFIGNNSKMWYLGQELSASDYVYCNVEEQYHNNILYFPAMSNKDQLYSFIKHAEACVLPSRFDNLPNTCIETMALGQIVIGTEGASFEQLIRDGYNGYLIERENKEQLYQKMEMVLNLSEAEKNKIRKCAAESVTRLEPDKIYNQILEFYKQAIG